MEYCSVELDASDDSMSGAVAAPSVTPFAVPAASTEECEPGHYWCVHRDCTDEIHPFSSQAALALHMQEAHRGRHTECAGEAAQETGSGWSCHWSVIRCGAPVIGPSIVRTVSSPSGGGKSSRRRDH